MNELWSGIENWWRLLTVGKSMREKNEETVVNMVYDDRSASTWSHCVIVSTRIHLKKE